MGRQPKQKEWLPVLGPRQELVYNSNKRYILLSGPRRSTKTTAACKRVIKHAWETPNARIAILATQMSAGKVGPWQLMFDMGTGLINEWVGDDDKPCLSGPNGDCEIIKRGHDPTTRAPYVTIRNYWGGESTFVLMSLDTESDVEKKFLGTVFTCIWVSELQNFKDPRVFTVLKEQLRAHWLAYEEHLWIADTNPPEEGEAHWAYDFWYRQRVSEEPPINEDGVAIMSMEDFKAFRDDLELFEFSIADNIFEDPKSLASLRATYANDPEGYARFIEGKWTRGGGHATKWFSRIFNRKVHIAISYDGDKDYEELRPEPDTNTLFTGWDPGEVNHAFAILQRRMGPTGPEWDILDEEVLIKQEVMLEDFAGACVEKMERQEGYIPRFAKLIKEGAQVPLNWTSWGDTSLSKFKPNTIQGNDAMIIQGVGAGRIRLNFAYDAKKSQAVIRRLMLIKDLLEKRRLFVSPQCTNTIDMFEHLKRGDGRFTHIAKGDKNKHIFDAISYVIYSEMLLSGDYKIAAPKRNRDLPEQSVITSVPL